MSTPAKSWAYELTLEGTFGRRTMQPQQPTSDEVLVKVHHTGICGSDLGVFLGRHPYKRPPVVLGHEMCGTVVEVGADVTSVSPGNLVATAAFCPCGACPQCRTGLINLCERRANLSHEGWAGTFASHVTLREPMVVPLSAQISPLQGVLVEPLSIAWHAWRRVLLERPRVAVVGVGGIGSAALVLARSAGAVHVTASDLGKDKDGYALNLGADRFLNASDPEDRVRYGEVNADLTLITNGHPSCLREALELTRPRGHVVVVSYSGQDVPIPLDAYVARELTLSTSHLATRRDVDKVVTLLEGGLDASRMIAQRLPIGEVAQAFEMLTAEASRPVGRVVLDIE